MKRKQIYFLLLAPWILVGEMAASAGDAARVFVEDFRKRWEDLGK